MTRGRVRRSTLVVTLIFLVTLVVFILVRPASVSVSRVPTAPLVTTPSTPRLEHETTNDNDDDHHHVSRFVVHIAGNDDFTIDDFRYLSYIHTGIDDFEHIVDPSHGNDTGRIGTGGKRATERRQPATVRPMRAVPRTGAPSLS